MPSCCGYNIMSSTKAITEAMETIEVSLDMVKNNKKLFYDLADNARKAVLEVIESLDEHNRAKLAGVLECIATYDAVVECL